MTYEKNKNTRMGVNKRKIAVYIRRDKYNSYGFEKELPDDSLYRAVIEEKSGEFAGLYFDYSHDKSHPALRQMITDYCIGKIDQLNIRNISHLADILDLLKEFQKREICVHFENEELNIDEFEKICLLLERWRVDNGKEN